MPSTNTRGTVTVFVRIEIVDARVPGPVGAKTTVMVQLFPGSSVAGKRGQVLFCEKSGKAKSLVMVSGVLPVLVSAVVFAALTVPTTWLPKLRCETLSVGIPGAATPDPMSGTACWPPGASSVMVIVPVREPVAVGLKVTEMLQKEPA
jgi:hypothetical protein